MIKVTMMCMAAPPVCNRNKEVMLHETRAWCGRSGVGHGMNPAWFEPLVQDQYGSISRGSSIKVVLRKYTFAFGLFLYSL